MDRLTICPWHRCVLLVLVTVVTYTGAFDGAFQYDDASTIFINRHLDGLDVFVGHLDHMVRPVLYTTLFFDRVLYGESATGYHILNLLLHLACGLLVYTILTHAVTEETRRIPFWTALLFLIHPIQTETVTYISGRASGLMGFFYLLAFFLSIRAGARERDGFPHRAYQFGAIVSFVLALGSKETAMTFPLVLLLWDLLICRLRGPMLRAAILSRHLPVWLILGIVGLWALVHPRYSALVQFSLGIRPLWDNALSEIHAATYAILLFFVPWKQSFDHDLPVFRSLFHWPLPLDLLLLGVVATCAFFLARRLPLVLFGIGWFLIQLLPTSFIPRNDLLSERNLYLASIGVFLVMVFLGSHLAQWLMKRSKRPRPLLIGARSVAVMLVLALCTMTFQRNVLYNDPVLLWSDTVEKSPFKARPHNNLGHAYMLRGDWDRAIEEFRIAARLDPDYALAQKNLRDAYLHQVERQ